MNDNEFHNQFWLNWMTVWNSGSLPWPPTANKPSGPKASTVLPSLCPHFTLNKIITCPLLPDSDDLWGEAPSHQRKRQICGIMVILPWKKGSVHANSRSYQSFSLFHIFQDCALRKFQRVDQFIQPALQVMTFSLNKDSLKHRTLCDRTTSPSTMFISHASVLRPAATSDWLLLLLYKWVGLCTPTQEQPLFLYAVLGLWL